MLVAQGAITKVGYNMLNRVQCSDINQHKTLKAEEQKIINPMLPTETTVCGCLNGLYHQSIFSNSVTILGKPSYRRLCKNWSGVRGGRLRRCERCILTASSTRAWFKSKRSDRQEFIRVKRFDIKFSEAPTREIGKIVGHNHFGIRANSRSKHMPVILCFTYAYS